MRTFSKKLREQLEDKVKRSVVRGDTADELIKNVQAVDWDKVMSEVFFTYIDAMR